MGVLYKSMKLQKQMKKNMVLDRLLELGITKNQSGKPVHECDYEELKTLWVLAEMRQVDIDHPDHRWFR
ncbi:hypothetical protein J7E63_13020 [Bacillus sp. ISL-75]|uniref:hypothetical protein n=1 Tax=Bacillus sp. ISL-75 TaxID=2819137 RepID=UPI001BE68BE7|nr:hypothetical protein [Bacillus sp. ISL-75]MBT2727861.1 hypothetical protein [Bacillus sp. ISL-75]